MDFCNENQDWRTVPLKLLPLNERHFTTNWAKGTYCYRFLFDLAITSQSYKNDSELEDWRMQALQMMKEIKQIGIAYGRQEIVNLARGHYGMTMPHSCGSKPTNIDDVMSIVENEEWYYDNKVYKQNIIYHLMYGLTRSGMNAWMLQQEHKWLKKHQIKYCQDVVGIRKTKLRGFVYSIINSKFSNSTIKLFRTVMQRKYGEFITVRKPIENVSSRFTYTQRQFLGGSGYIVSCDRGNDGREYDNSDSYESIGSRWIKMCIEDRNMSVADVHKVVDELYTTYTGQIMPNVNNMVSDEALINNNLTCVTPNKDIKTPTETDKMVNNGKEKDITFLGELVICQFICSYDDKLL